ncbi:MAG: 30S ribosomal protein S7 [Planctomycetes bacterium]|uniref:30S ribosomal protein S7 n=1 Tax=Candidatus Wunengus sp. YC65 TaxID=3367701 RepID=UPI001D81A80D|nr:30S ribosomal protein S7 [Planctomycetota bacterium]MBI5794961.1 30S ribosomal protein S7 [Planctomycetota bacterium]
MALAYRSTEVFLQPDIKYKSKLVSKFINSLMRKGKKSVAEGVFYGAMEVIEKKITDVTPLEMFETAVNNVKPLVEVRSKRVGGATYQVPVEVPKQRQQSLAIRWIIGAAQGKKGRPMFQRLADELVDAYKKQGIAITQRENTHKMAEANKAFAHFAWSKF